VTARLTVFLQESQGRKHDQRQQDQPPLKAQQPAVPGPRRRIRLQERHCAHRVHCQHAEVPQPQQPQPGHSRQQAADKAGCPLAPSDHRGAQKRRPRQHQSQERQHEESPAEGQQQRVPLGFQKIRAAHGGRKTRHHGRMRRPVLEHARNEAAPQPEPPNRRPLQPTQHQNQYDRDKNERVMNRQDRRPVLPKLAAYQDQQRRGHSPKQPPVLGSPHQVRVSPRERRCLNEILRRNPRGPEPRNALPVVTVAIPEKRLEMPLFPQNRPPVYPKPHRQVHEVNQRLIDDDADGQVNDEVGQIKRVADPAVRPCAGHFDVLVQAALRPERKQGPGDEQHPADDQCNRRRPPREAPGHDEPGTNGAAIQPQPPPHGRAPVSRPADEARIFTRCGSRRVPE